MTTRAHKSAKATTSNGSGVASCRASVKIDERNIPNPYYNKVFQLADSEEYEYIMGLVGDKTEEEELAILLANPDVMEAVYTMLDRFDEIPLVPATMPPAPHALNLYSRTSDDAYVADIGSGDGAKASKSQSKISFYDVEPGAAQVRVLDAEREELPLVDVVTSYNTLTQLKNPEKLLDVDSLHIFPDVEFVKTQTGATKEGDVYVSKCGQKLFRDYDKPLSGDVISEGYKCVTGYQKSKLNLSTTRQLVLGQPFAVPVEDTKVELAGEATPKYDGVGLKLIFAGGDASLLLRSGRGVKMKYKTKEHYCGKCRCHYAGSFCCGRRCASDMQRVRLITALPKDFVLFLEKLNNDDGESAYALLRVSAYGRMIPFHGLENLREFCKKVSITIDGVALLPPGHDLLQGYKTDGFIYRHDFRDYRLKDIYTVDVKDVRRFVLTAFRRGYIVEADSDIDLEDKATIKELQLTTASGLFFLKLVRERSDKLLETDYHGDRIGHILDMATAATGAASPKSHSIDLTDDSFVE